MSAIFIMLIISLVIALGFLIAFIWAVKNGQFDDDYTPSMRALFDNEVKQNNQIINKNITDSNEQ